MQDYVVTIVYIEQINPSPNPSINSVHRAESQQAVNDGWEPQEVVKLLILIFKQLDIENNKTKIIKFITNLYDIITPAMLTLLEDEGISFDVDEIMNFIEKSSEDYSEPCVRFLANIEDCFEQGLFDRSNAFQIYNIACQTSFVTNDLIFDLAALMCSHVNTKKHCGQILNVFTR